MKYVHRHGKRIAIEALSSSAPTKERTLFKLTFVKLYSCWIERLARSNNPGTFKLFHRILQADFKRQITGGEVVLSTDATRLSRKVRSRAVKELVELGLI